MTATLNASTANGVILTSDTSGSLAIQSNGTTIATAQSSGLTISSYTAGASLITNGTAQASTSGTSIDFTGIPSWVKRVTVMFNGVSTSGSSVVQIQLGTTATPTYATSGYLGTVTLINSGGAGTAQYTGAGFATEITPSAASVRYGTVVFTLVDTNNNWACNGAVGYSDSAIISPTAGGKSLGATLTAVRITTVNGTDTFDAGSINILYEG